MNDIHLADLGPRGLLEHMFCVSESLLILMSTYNVTGKHAITPWGSLL